MSPKKNPLKLNPLQLKTLTLLQEMAHYPELATPVAETEDLFLSQIPHPHGDHFHIGDKVVSAHDATGLHNPSVWAALERKGLVKGSFPYALTLTKEGQIYETGIAEQILHGSSH
ncbi:hypothetical protein [Telmatospirillum sp.]|uniref:hypothetical protein n=1 Tax=Telmatospirillum sp. TaxID=2079197 RepID=UPI0028473633|nr:hypothetical protein [Telmatospirillum sp.]MDR3437104.1 hypothetical protein [Telmatospirillum sp.]